MAKHLSKNDVDAIVDIIRGWEGQKLTWPAICEACAPVVGKLPTRQSLSAHDEIVGAYRAKKSALKGQGPANPRPASLRVAAARIANVEAELNEIKEQNRRFKEMFTRWQYNAYKRGMTGNQLNEPLPRIDRERTDGETR